MRLISPICEAQAFPLDEAILAVEMGWPGPLVAKAIAASEAQDANGVDYWLETHGLLSWFGSRDYDEPRIVTIMRKREMGDGS